MGKLPWMVYESDETDAGCDLDAAQANPSLMMQRRATRPKSYITQYAHVETL